MVHMPSDSYSGEISFALPRQVRSTGSSKDVASGSSKRFSVNLTVHVNWN